MNLDVAGENSDPTKSEFGTREGSGQICGIGAAPSGSQLLFSLSTFKIVGMATLQL